MSVIDIKRSAGLCLRILTLRASGEQLLALNRQDLVFGLLCCWVVGIGRWWDDPHANLILHTGIVSVLYPFVLGTLLWLFMWPLRPGKWSYIRLVTYISMTAPPAILYAIPVEQFFAIKTAMDINAWFLVVVALWRLTMLLTYTIKATDLGVLESIAGSYGPIFAIVLILTELNLHKVVFDVMMGARQSPDNFEAGGFQVLLLLGLLMSVAAIPFLLFYVGLAILAWVKKARKQATEPTDAVIKE